MIENRCVAPRPVRCSERWRRAWKAGGLRVCSDSGGAELDRGHLRARRAERRGGLLRLRERSREMLAQRAIRRMGANAVRSRRRLDVRKCARAHRVALELRIGDGNHRWHQELQQGRDPPQHALKAARSAHPRRLGVSQGERYQTSRELTGASYPAAKRPRRVQRESLSHKQALTRSRNSAADPAFDGRWSRRRRASAFQ